MTEEQFDAAMAHYTSPFADLGNAIFVHRDANGHETPIPLQTLLNVAQNTLDKWKVEALAFRELAKRYPRLAADIMGTAPPPV